MRFLFGLLAFFVVTVAVMFGVRSREPSGNYDPLVDGPMDLQYRGEGVRVICDTARGNLLYATYNGVAVVKDGCG